MRGIEVHAGRRRRITFELSAFGALLATCATLSACGGSSDAEAEIRGLIHTAWTSSSPSACTKLLTRRFAEQTTQVEGIGAIEACENEMSENTGQQTATPSAIRVAGSKATADLALAGVDLGGQVIRVALVKVHDRWKLASIVGFVGIDRRKLLKALVAKVEEGVDELPPLSVVQCSLEAMSTFSIRDLDEYVFSGSTGPQQRLLDRCTANGTLSTQ